MPAQPQLLPPPAALPDLTGRLAPTFTALIRLIAACFCRHPRFAAIILPLCRRLTLTRLRIERTLARLAAGKPAQRRSPPPRAPQPANPPSAEAPAVARPRIPTSPAWLQGRPPTASLQPLPWTVEKTRRF